jgi:hypothetical protein
MPGSVVPTREEVVELDGHGFEEVLGPGGHPNSPAFGHPKFLHPCVSTAVAKACLGYGHLTACVPLHSVKGSLRRVAAVTRP